MGKTKLVKTNYATPGEPMSQQEFEEMIKKAENGPFYTIAEVRAKFEKWKLKYSK